MLILDTNLNGIEKFFHGIIENTKISSSSYDIFLNDLYLLIKFSSTFVKIVQKMLILVIFSILFLSTYTLSYIVFSHCFAKLLLFSHFIAYYIKHGLPCSSFSLLNLYLRHTVCILDAFML